MKQIPLFDWTPDGRCRTVRCRAPKLILPARLCERCGKQFAPNRGTQKFCTQRCCNAAIAKRDYRKHIYRHRNRAAQRRRSARHLDYRLQSKYGITLADFNRILAEQGGGCGICGAVESRSKGPRLHVDHDHVTGKVRGLLCAACNHGIGQLGDDSERVKSAVRYLERAKGESLTDVMTLETAADDSAKTEGIH